MKACRGAHHIGPFCLQNGHESRLMSPLHVRPYVKVHKNGDRDAAAVAKAATRPKMAFAAIRSEEQLDLYALHPARERLVDLVNVALDLGSAEARNHLADFRDVLITLSLSRQSSATSGVIRSESTDLVETISRFAQTARHVLGNPARKLTEIEELQPTGRLRPNTRTFRQVLRRPSRRWYRRRDPTYRTIVSCATWCNTLQGFLRGSPVHPKPKHDITARGRDRLIAMQRRCLRPRVNRWNPRASGTSLPK